MGMKVKEDEEQRAWEVGSQGTEKPDCWMVGFMYMGNRQDDTWGQGEGFEPCV